MEVPDLPGCISKGNTLEEAEKNIEEAVELYLETLEERGIPLGNASQIEQDVEEVIFSDEGIKKKAKKLARLFHSITEVHRKRNTRIF